MTEVFAQRGDGSALALRRRHRGTALVLVLVLAALSAGLISLVYNEVGGAHCANPDPRAYRGSECYGLSAALKMHGLVLPATATSVGFKVADDDQLWLSFVTSPAGLAAFVSQSEQCTPKKSGGAGIDTYAGDQVGWPFETYLATIYSAQSLLTCEGGTVDEDDEISVYRQSPTVDIVYWYSQSMEAFNN